VKARAAREGRDPATGQPMTIKASKKLAITPAKAVKDKLIGGCGLRLTIVRV